MFLVTPDGAPVSVCGKLNADKWNPVPIPGLGEGFAMLEDNVAVEYNIPPATSADEFVKHIQAAQKKLIDQFKGLKFSKLSCTVFPDSEMTHPGAHIFGCEPDFNAWTNTENFKPQPPVPNMRSAGGHVHIETDKDKRHVIQVVDLFLGIPSLFMDEGEDRRKLYGKAGCFRPKLYGVEYRTLSNFWTFKAAHIRWVWNQVERALNYVAMPAWMEYYLSNDGDAVQHAINNNDMIVAKRLIKEYNLSVV